MKLALFGATGRIGKRILRKALARGHQVTGIVRNPSRDTERYPGFSLSRGDVTDASSVAAAVKGSDAVVSSIQPDWQTGNWTMLVDAARALAEGLRRAALRRLIVVGGAGSLAVSPGVRLMDTPGFPAEVKPLAAAHLEALEFLRSIEDLDWTSFSPADRIEPGKRTGKYRTGLEQLVRDAGGRSFISMEDFAVALLDELEHPRHIRQRFTAAY